MDSNLLPLVRKRTPLPTGPLLYLESGNSILLIRMKSFTDNYDAQHQDLAPLGGLQCPYFGLPN